MILCKHLYKLCILCILIIKIIIIYKNNCTIENDKRHALKKLCTALIISKQVSNDYIIFQTVKWRMDN